MKKIIKLFLLGAMLPHSIPGESQSGTLCTDMLTEFKACFLGERPLELLINEWKWGDIKKAFLFCFQPMAQPPELESVEWILAACPFSSEPNWYFDKTEFPKVSDLKERDRPYFMFGVSRNLKSKKHSLVFLSCDKSSVMYPDFLKFFGLREPSYDEMRTAQPDQCWETTVRDGAGFTWSRIDDQFIRWGEFNPRLDWVFRFNQKKCAGVMLRERTPVQSDGREAGKARPEFPETLDLREFTEAFKWVSDHQLERFDKETQMHSAARKAGNQKGIGYARARLARFEEFREKHKDTETRARRFGLKSLGTVKTPSCDIFDDPWTIFGYSSAFGDGLILRSIAKWEFPVERDQVDSFVLDVGGMSEKTDLLLPRGLDIKPYLQAYPSANVLYEHVRADNRARIVVQPYIAYLYNDQKLIKVLVCNDKNGPEDHGWSLYRGYYCYEWMARYYWPVSRAYCPLETN